MIYLLDTHTLIWTLEGDKKLSKYLVAANNLVATRSACMGLSLKM